MSDGSCRFSVKQEISDTNKMQLLENANAIPTLGNIFQSYFTNPTTANLAGWYTILSLNGGNTTSQIRFPMTSSRASRTAIRCQSALKETGVINEPWRELAYADEVPVLKDNGNNTKKITVDRFEGTSDSSVSQDYIQDLGSYTNRTVGELKQTILDSISIFNYKACIYIRITGHMIKACQNWENDSYVIEPGGTLNTICIRNIYDRGRWAFIEMFSYGYDKYVTFLSNGKWMPMKKVSLIDV